MVRWPRWLRWRKLDTTIADGELVVVTGIVRAVGALLEAPISGTPSVAYSSVARISERRIGTRYGNRLLTQVADRRVVPFELETTGHRIRIEVSEVELAIAELPLVPRDLERERAFVARHASASVDLHTVVFEERCLVAGASVEVRGLAVAEADPLTGEHGFRDAATRFRLVAHDGHPVAIRSAR